jgi:uncharacterized protein YbcC (UPF0753/DUF2309 family)
MTDHAPSALAADVAAALHSIAPAWPLAATVAVNPWTGHADEPFARTAARFARLAGQRLTLPRAFYAGLIADGTITDDDLAAALAAQPAPGISPAMLRTAARQPETLLAALPTVADLAATASGLDWPGIVADRIGAFAADYFDAGQALWAAPQGRDAFRAWRAFAAQDLSVDILGLPGFARQIADGAAEADEAIAAALAALGVPAAARQGYLEQLLLSLGGWAQMARQRLFEAERDGGSDTTLRDLLAVRIAWEAALFAHVGPRIAADWQATLQAHAAPLAPGPLLPELLLQDAFDRSAQRRLAERLAAPRPAGGGAPRPALQAAFCIDVRSEVFRRALEQVDDGIATLGFAGFFGLAAHHHGAASDVAEARGPVLLTPALATRAGAADDPVQAGRDVRQRFAARAVRAWRRFKLAAVSSFAFVEAMGPVYALKLLRDALALARPHRSIDPAPAFDPPLPLPQRVAMAATVLRAMSLTDGFGRLVLLLGHGAVVVNNAHGSALQCGACGGHAGDVNARLLAILLNTPEVRQGLVAEGITIPADTLVLAGLHDTVSDRITLYTQDVDTAAHAADLARAKRWLDAAGARARDERALRLPRAASGAALPRRGRDWAELRPEWGLAGCHAFIAAPRHVTAGRDLRGEAFLHSYDWRRDSSFAVLELILTAPVVVASWISLQYYGSAVAPALFGAGNKLLHNVVGGVGVVEGNRGLLRTGLPWQSVHDGERLMHPPRRLSVMIAAPVEAIDGVLTKHPAVRALFDNGWLALFALDAEGRVEARYGGTNGWQPVGAAPAPRLRAAAAS